MNNVFSDFISSFLGSMAEFLASDPVIYFVACFLLLAIVGVFRQLMHISR